MISNRPADRLASCLARIVFSAAWLLVSFGILWLPVVHAAPTQAVYFVDPVSGNDAYAGSSISAPFLTIARARDAVRTINTAMTGDIYVYLRGGTYSLASTLALDDRDSGTNGYTVHYCAYINEKPVLSGGRTIAGWALYDSAKNIYAATPGPLETRQLFVNGVRCVRAKGSVGLTAATTGSAGYTTTDTFLAGWKNISDLEMVYEAIWTKPRCGVSDITVSGTLATVTMDQPGFTWVRNKGITSVGVPLYYENAYELLDAAGEWYLDRTGAISGTACTLFYIPKTGETMSSAKVVAPVLEKLVTIQGRAIDTPVNHLELQGLTFQYTTWLRPNGTSGHSDAQNNVLREKPGGVNTEFIVDGAALTLKYASSVAIERCTFASLGATGINAYAGCQGNTIRGNVFNDVAANGLQLGDYLSYSSTTSESYCYLSNPAQPTLDRRLILKNNTVANNYFNNCGVEYRSATALAAAFPQESSFLHNEIQTLPYSGIHIGWGWGAMPATDMGRNLVQYNIVRNIMQDLNDGGCIYLMGSQRSGTDYSTVSNNYVSGCSNQGLYFDDGACYYHAADNITTGIGDQIVKIAGTNKHDIDVVRTYATKAAGTYTAPNVTVEPAILQTSGTWPWPSGATITLQNAGLEPAYVDIKAPQTMSVYEAESATKSGGAYTATTNKGFFGTGYVEGFYNVTGAATTFSVSASTAGSYEITIRYSAGNGTSTNTGLYVNGTKLRNLTFPSTGSWTCYATRTESVRLLAGANTIALRSESSSGQCINIDNLTLTSGLVTYQAENGLLTGGIATTVIGSTNATGSGLVGYYANKLGAATILQVFAKSAGSHNLIVRYCAGNGDCTSLGLYVNGLKLKNLNLPRCPNWNTYLTVTESAYLNPGWNTIALRSEEAVPSLTANLDSLGVEYTGTVPAATTAVTWSGAGQIAPLSWKSTANWQSETVPDPAATSSLSFLTNQILAEGTVVAQQDFTPNFATNSLILNGTGGGLASVRIAGNTIRLQTSGTFAPSIQNNATLGNGLGYDLATPVECLGPVTISGTGSANFQITGGLSGTSVVTKTGTTTLWLGGTNTLTGDIKLANGGLGVLPNTSFAGGVHVLGGTLTGNGAFNGGLFIEGGVHQPGSPIGGGASSQYNLGPAATLQVDVSGTTPLLEYDQWTVTGTATLNGTLQINLTGSNTITENTPLMLLVNTGTLPIQGRFSNIPANDIFYDSNQWWRISYSGGDGNDLTLTRIPPAAMQTWQLQWFAGQVNNDAIAAPLADPNHDGEPNFLEFATGQDPSARTMARPSVTAADDTLEFHYTRSIAAVNDSVQFIVEWSDSLASGSWSAVGVSQTVNADDGVLQSVTATVNRGASARRFLRLRVVGP